MIQKLVLPGAILILMCSCGASKKLKSANAQIDQLNANNAALQKNIDALKQQVSGMTSDNSSLSNQLNSCQQNAQAVARKYAASKAILDEQADNVKKLQQRLDQGLADFESKGVNVYTKDGVLHVQLEDYLLYKSGSSVLSDSGKKALEPLAGVLKDYPNLRVIVEGNADSVKFKKGGMDNWTLSTERANGVVRVLRDNGVDPSRLISAGKGRYNPVADNSTAEGRAKNRRTDIILNPDWDKVWESMQNGGAGQSGQQ
jgi:chemotaxis protein MotB